MRGTARAGEQIGRVRADDAQHVAEPGLVAQDRRGGAYWRSPATVSCTLSKRNLRMGATRSMFFSMHAASGRGRAAQIMRLSVLSRVIR